MQLPLFDKPELYRRAQRTAQTVQRTNNAAKQPQLQPIIECVVGVLGTIDLDPHCTVPSIPSKLQYTSRERGLAKTWRGRVWLNAPNGRTTMKWVDKLITEYEQGDVTEAIAMFPARTNTDWWKALAKYPFCTLFGKVTYLKPDGSTGASATPHIVVYMGSQMAKFATKFNKLGTIYIPYM
jgi:hypothetical protein